MNLKSRKIISMALVFFMMLTILPLAPVTAHAAGTLPAPTWSSAEDEKYTIKWNADDHNATEVWIALHYSGSSKGFYTTNDGSQDLSSYIKLLGSGDYYVSIQGKSCEAYSANSATKTFNFANQLSQPTNVRWNGSVATWDPVEGADRYWFNAYKGSAQILPGNYTTETSMDLTDHMLASGSYTFTVQAYSFGDIAASNMVTSPVKEKDATLYPMDVKFGDGITKDRYLLYWDAIPSTNGYWIKVYKDGSLLSGSDGATDIPVTSIDLESIFARHGNGNYTVEVTAHGATYADKTAEDSISINYQPCTVTLSVEPTGAGVVTGKGTFNKGDDITVTATAKTGYKFVKWTEGATNVSSSATYNFQINEDRNLVAVFEAESSVAFIDSLEITGLQAPVAGQTPGTPTATFTPAGAFEVTDAMWLESNKGVIYGSFVAGKDYLARFRLTPNAGKAFPADLNKDDITTDLGEVTQVDVLANFTYVYVKVKEGTVPTPTVTITSVTINPTSAEVEKGKTQQFAAEVSGTGEYNKSVQWSVTGGTDSTIDGNGKLTVGANETATTLSVIAKAAGDTSKTASAIVTVKAPATEPNKITEIALTGNPVLEVGKQASEDISVFAVEAGHNYTVTAVSWWDVTAGGWVGYDNLIEDHEYRAHIKIEPNSGYEFAASLNATMNGNPATVDILDGGKCVVYNFGTPKTEVEPTTYTVTWKSQDGSSTLETDNDVASGAAPSYDGTEPTKAADAQYTYTFVGWATSANQEIGTAENALPTVSGDVTYYAVFSKSEIEYTITVEGGKASVGAGTPVDKATAGTELTLTVDESKIPAGQVFDKWEVVSGGVTVTDGKFKMPENTVVVKATYKAAEHEHTYGELIAAQAEVHTQAELKAAVAAHYFCDVCDTYFTEEKVETTLAALTGTTPAHSYGVWVNTDTAKHWKECSCGLKAEEAAHVYDNSKDATCNVCEYTRTISSGSSSGGGFSGSYNYPVIVGDTDGADVAVSDEHATKGEEITVTVKPDAGEQVDEVIVTDKDGKVIPVIKTGDNEYTFTMPASKVTVDVATEAADYGLRIVMQINNKNILVNGKTMVNDVAPVIVGDRTLVPIRVVTELLGGSADWDNDTRTVTLKIDGKVLSMTIGKPIPGFGTSAVIMNDRTYVPVRYVMEKLGAEVEWINATQQIIIEK